MALPGNLTAIVVTATFKNPDGSNASGTVTFTPSTTLQDTGAVATIAQSTISAPLVAGAISVTLAANDDPDLSPSGTTYTVVERVSGAPSRTYSVVIPSAAPSGTIDLSALAPQAASAGVGYLYRPLIELVNLVAASGTAKTLPDVNVATMHDVTLTGNCTFTFPTLAAGKSFKLVLRQDATGSRTVTWPGTVKWPAATAPTITATASHWDIYDFIAAGTNWLGRGVAQNYS